jgi:hypothetical protein
VREKIRAKEEVKEKEREMSNRRKIYGRKA